MTAKYFKDHPVNADTILEFSAEKQEEEKKKEEGRPELDSVKRNLGDYPPSFKMPLNIQGNTLADSLLGPSPTRPSPATQRMLGKRPGLASFNAFLAEQKAEEILAQTPMAMRLAYAVAPIEGHPPHRSSPSPIPPGLSAEMLGSYEPA